MKKIPIHVKRRLRQRSKTVRVVGVVQPLDETLSEEELSKLDLYITDTELSDWFQRFQKNVLAGKSNELIEEDTIYLSLILSDLQRELFGGAYEATNENPLFAMEAFVAAHHLGLYPPPWVLDWLYAAFEKYLTSPQEDDIAKLLLAKRGKGKAPVKKENQRLQLETAAMYQIQALNLTGKSIEEAAAMVAASFEARGIVDCPTAETLAERYSKRGWGKVMKLLKEKLGDL